MIALTHQTSPPDQYLPLLATPACWLASCTLLSRDVETCYEQEIRYLDTALCSWVLWVLELLVTLVQQLQVIPLVIFPGSYCLEYLTLCAEYEYKKVFVTLKLPSLCICQILYLPCVFQGMLSPLQSRLIRDFPSRAG